MKNKALKLLALMLTMIMIISSVSMSAFALAYGEEWAGYESANTKQYSDVPEDHWAHTAIMATSAKNWFSGYPDGSFKPTGTITRAEALKVFVMFTGLEVTPVTKTSFYDVDPNAWYAPYVEAGKDLFPTHTTIQGKNPFQPDMPVTREDTIYALVNALGYQVGEKFMDESVLNMFSDKSSISGDYKGHFVIALKNQLVSGFPDGTIRAQASLTRAEFATLLYRGTTVGHSGRHEAKISSVTVSPASPVEIAIGESVTLSARATYTDGTSQQYTALSPYDALNNGVVSLSGTTITGLKEGTTTIKYNDSYLTDDSLTVVVTKPESNLAIKLYEYPEKTDMDKTTVIGEVIDADVKTVDLVCNSKDINVGDDGSFAANISLNVGENVLNFVATNQYGDKAEKAITITRTNAPVIEITDYKERTTARKTTISGKVIDQDIKTVVLDCNGNNVALSENGSFTAEVELKTGKNKFTFTAKNQFGQQDVKQVTITRYEIIEEEEEEEEEEINGIESFEWNWDFVLEQAQYSGIEMVIAMDDSGSMSWNDSSNQRAVVAKDLVDSLPANSTIGMVKFGSGSDVVTAPISDKNTIKSYLGSLQSSGGTALFESMEDSIGLFKTNSSETMKMVVWLTDGESTEYDTSSQRQNAIIASANNANIAIYVIGLGDENSSYFNTVLKPFSNNTNGEFFFVNDAAGLKAVFDQIGVKIDLVVDTDSDGISDYFEDNMVDNNGVKFSLDKNSADTDGDGIIDGKEIVLKYTQNNDKVTVNGYMVSDPTKVDTDNDGKSDSDDQYPLDAALQ